MLDNLDSVLSNLLLLTSYTVSEKGLAHIKFSFHSMLPSVLGEMDSAET